MTREVRKLQAENYITMLARIQPFPPSELPHAASNWASDGLMIPVASGIGDPQVSNGSSQSRHKPGSGVMSGDGLPAIVLGVMRDSASIYSTQGRGGEGAAWGLPKILEVHFLRCL